MRFLLDTCVLEELVGRKPSRRVVDWVQARRDPELFLSILSLGEIHAGIAAVSDPGRRQGLHAWVETDLSERFAGRILAVDASVARAWAAMVPAVGVVAARPSMRTEIIAATAMAHDLVVVSRHTRGYTSCGVEVLDPWKGGSHVGGLAHGR